MDNNKNFTIMKPSPQFVDYFDKLKEITEFVPREINYQLELIKPFLESVLAKQIQVIDTSNNTKDTNIHTRESYTTAYGAAPDLIITSGYKYANRNLKSPIVYAAVEIKKPLSKENINGEIKDYHVHVIEEMATYLCKCENIILTNCKIWKFLSWNKKYDKRLLFNFADLLPILNIENNDWYLVDGKKNIPAVEERLKILKEEQYDKLESFFENDEDPMLNQVRNYDDKSCIDGTEIKCLLNNLREYLDNYIREVIVLVPCKTIDLLSQKNFMYETHIKEPKEWEELVNYLQDIYNK
ncbi:hypothetical protein NRP93_003534 [Clostridium botulinum]|nr:hypothetical protein [Clostridium botulinum]